MSAALGRSQLRRIERNLGARKDNFSRLKDRLAEAPDVRVLDSTEDDAVSSHYCLSVVLEGTSVEFRNRLVTKLNLAGVGTSVYYPQPVPRMSYYRKKYGYNRQACCFAEAISDRSIALPVGPHLSDADVDYVAQTFVRILKEETNV